MLKVLTINRKKEPFKGSSALPGGFLKQGETSIDTVKRILKDKAGLENIFTEQLYTFDELKRDPRGPVISIAYFAIAPLEQINILESDQTEDPKFIPVRPIKNLAFDHKKIVTYALERLMSKLEYTNVSYSLLSPTFTLTELQTIYEAVFDKLIDKRNFRKKFMQLGLLEDTKKLSKGGRQRPARLYKFKVRKTQELKKFFS
jgi:8-oxo-dGTP diphosphatase